MFNWTPPRTWQTGDLVTADDLNGELRDRMLWLHSHRPAVTLFEFSTSYSTSSTAFTPFDPSVSITMETHGLPLMIGLNCYVYLPYRQGVGFRYKVDGAVPTGHTDGNGRWLLNYGESINRNESISVMSWLPNIAPGTHTFTLEWRAQQSGQGSVSLYSNQNISQFYLVEI